MSIDDFSKNDPLLRLQETLVSMGPTRLLREQDPYYRMRELVPDLSIATQVDRLSFDTPVIDIIKGFSESASAAHSGFADKILSAADDLAISNALFEAVANPIPTSIVDNLSRSFDVAVVTPEISLASDLLCRLAAAPTISFAAKVRFGREKDVSHEDDESAEDEQVENHEDKEAAHDAEDLDEPAADFSKLDLPSGIHKRLVRVDYLPLDVHLRIIRDQETLFDLSPRQFEEYIGDLLSGLGFEDIELTPHSGDRGRDLVAIKRVEEIPVLFAFECKRYARERPIGPGILRMLLGTVKSRETPASVGVLVTTSHFSRGSRELIMSEPNIDGKDFDALARWIEVYAERKGLL